MPHRSRPWPAQPGENRMTFLNRSRVLRLRGGVAPMPFAWVSAARPVLGRAANQATRVPTPATQDAADNGPDIVVTGSLFRRTDTETPSPVTVLTADSL